MSAQQKGKKFEKDINNLLKRNYKEVYNETYIRNKYDYITGIDHVLKINNILICIQDKWTKKPISNSQINHFISSIEQLKEVLNNDNNTYIGLYISKKPFSKIAKKIANKKYISSINDENDKNIKQKLLMFLYDFNNLSYNL